MNVKLLRKIQKHILAEPRRLNMEWIATAAREVAVDKIPPCGTICCISGWASVLSRPSVKLRVVEHFLYNPKNKKSYAARDGMEKLQIDQDQGLRLFYVSYWPPMLRNRFWDSKGNKQLEAALAVERIDLFIESEGKE
jgi:hypothetical protein